MGNPITPELTTERLHLRQIKGEDVQSIHECWMQDEEVSRYMYWKSSVEIQKTKDFVNFELEKITSDQWYRWIIELRDSGTIIGTAMIYFNEDENNWDISYNLGREFWSHGYITEAMKEIIKFATEELDIHVFIAAHAYENSASRRIIEKLGFQYIKDIPYDCNGNTFHTTGRYYELTV